MGCASVSIPNVAIYKEIPFQDGAEAVFIESLTHKEGLLSHSEWEAKRPYMIQISPEGWSAIKKQWHEACRPAGEKCNAIVDSIDRLIRQLDKIARAAFPK